METNCDGYFCLEDEVVGDDDDSQVNASRTDIDKDDWKQVIKAITTNSMKKTNDESKGNNFTVKDAKESLEALIGENAMGVWNKTKKT